MAEYSKIGVTEIGPVVLVTRSAAGSITGKYVCSSVSINMAVGQIPTASVLIGCGTSIESPGRLHGQSADKLLSKVARRDGATYGEMARCSLYEADPGTRDIDDVTKTGTLLFKGVIVNGTYVYKTGQPTAKMVRLTCMNEAVNIYALPVSELTMSTGSQALNAIYGVSSGAEKNASDANMSPVMSAYDNLAQLGLPGYGPKADIATKVAALLACVIYAHSADGKVWSLSNMHKHVPRYYSEIRNCIFSSWHVNDKVVTDYYEDNKLDSSSVPGNSFDRMLLSALTSAYGAGTIFQMLVSALCGNEYMLELVPRFGGSFRMELKPSTAWNTSSPRVKLKKKHLIGVESGYNPIATLHIPDVYIVTFDELSSDVMGSQGGQMNTYTSGVYARDPSVRSAFRQVIGADGKGFPGFDETLYRVRSFKAPSWLRPSRSHVVSGGGGKTLVSRLRMPAASGYGNSVSSYYNPTVSNSLADRIAQALFAYNYGAEDKCSIELSPDLRFGKADYPLENMLGEVIALELSDDEDSPLNMLGMLESISYRYTAGASKCTVSYQATISRTRQADDTFSLECPLYI